MKKLSIAFVLLLVASLAAKAQFDIGLKVMSNVSMNTVRDDSNTDGLEYSSNGSGIRYGIGVVTDFYFAENYAFAMGLNFIVKRAGVTAKLDPSTNISEVEEPELLRQGDMVHNLQYLQIPIGLKLFTNPVMDDLRIYFNVGGTIDIKVAERMITSPENADYVKAYENSSHYSLIDAGAFLVVGGELEMGESTKAFAGLFYHRNFLNIVAREIKTEDSEVVPNWGSSNQNQLDNKSRVGLSQLGLEVGIKF